MEDRWEFWIDRGGTFTDVVALNPDGDVHTAKLLSHNPGRYHDAAMAGIRSMMGLGSEEPIPGDAIASVKMGTTVATNALLERRGRPTVLVITEGFGDALRIGTQARPDLFALDIVLPDMLYEMVVEARERLAADGSVVIPLDRSRLEEALARARSAGFDSAAIVFVHGYRFPAHEAEAAAMARALGFSQVSVSHEVSPLRKLVPRGDTTVVDAYLSPVLRGYVDGVAAELPGVDVTFMQSNGGRVRAAELSGKDALLSGPAGGVVGMIRTGMAAGFDRLVGFDMGGTSTDVSHYSGEYERTYEGEVAGVRVRAPMMRINTVAAGGGSMCWFDGVRLRVGPESAGAEPGPAAYGSGGPATITDCNVMLGRLRPEYFPAIFGAAGTGRLDAAASKRRFAELAAEVSEATGGAWSPTALAEGYLEIAVESMANAIKRISVQRGHDLVDHVLVCFGGAGGQHACAVADRLGVDTVLVDRHAGVLSAVGVGLADVRRVREQTVEAPLTEAGLAAASSVLDQLAEAGIEALGGEFDEVNRSLAIRYDGSDTALAVPFAGVDALAEGFVAAHRARFGFSGEGPLVIGRAEVEVIRSRADIPGGDPEERQGDPVVGSHLVSFAGGLHETPFVERSSMSPATTLEGPLVVVEENATTVVEPGWSVNVGRRGELILRRVQRVASVDLGDTSRSDPVQLEIFNSLFVNVAEQMGMVLENTASSVNIKERLDFSCAVFDRGGDLIANAPHVPVHLGSMSESVKAVINAHRTEADPLVDGDAFVLNAPYSGGTHLPDVTVVRPVFRGGEPEFFVAARGHHADIGGVVPGSAPPLSSSVHEEGILFEGERVVDAGRLRENWLRAKLESGPHPARNPDRNVSDLRAQLAACEKGVAELGRLVDRYGLGAVRDYMMHVRANAAEAVSRLFETLPGGHYVCEGDDGDRVEVAVKVDHAERRAVIDFSGSSPQHEGNRNAPTAVTTAAVLYAMRCLVHDEIPLNSGCLEPVDLVIPELSILAPRYPAAVMAGNVETSQLIVDAIFGALGTMAGSQGTMNNVLFGNDRHQYYETLCGGAGATDSAPGCDAVHTHMTNSRLTDPEVLEDRFPVMVESFSIRRGSGGRGRNRGGDGVVRRLRFAEPMTLSLLTSRRLVAPHGMAGGESGAVGVNRLLRANGTVEVLPGAAATQVVAGDVLEIATPGGGGWGHEGAYRAGSGQ